MAACANGSSPAFTGSPVAGLGRFGLLHLMLTMMSAWAALWWTPIAGGQVSIESGEVQPDWMRGLDFGGIRLPSEARDADAVFSARRAWSWRSGRADRLVLQGDVRVHIDVFDFAAERAVVWLEQMSLEQGRVWQIAVYFDNVRTPLAAAAIAQSSRRLLVTGVIRGDVTLKTPLLNNQPAPTTPFLAEAENRFARRLIALAGEQDVLPTAPTFPGLPKLARAPDEESDGLERTFYEPAEQPPPLDPQAPIFGDTGVITFYAPDRTLITGEEENALVITGGVVMQYTDLDRDVSLEVTAERAVVFLDPGGVVETLQFGAERVRGVYLEGEARATNGRYTLRGPRVYYDVRRDQAVVLDAVFHTFDQRRGMPVYVRAEQIRQESLAQWEAHNATLANASFIDPLFSIGATSVTLRRERRGGGAGQDQAQDQQRVTTVVQTQGASLQLGGRRALPLPNFKGEIDQTRTFPQVRIETRNDDPIVRTRWDIYSLLGQEPPQGTRAELLLDGHFDRGPAVGADVQWDTGDAEGEAFAYYINDSGEDLLSSGADGLRRGQLHLRRGLRGRLFPRRG